MSRSESLVLLNPRANVKAGFQLISENHIGAFAMPMMEKLTKTTNTKVITHKRGSVARVCLKKFLLECNAVCCSSADKRPSLFWMYVPTAFHSRHCFGPSPALDDTTG